MSVILCGPTCGHNHDSLNGPTGCCAEHGPYMYFCGECHEERKGSKAMTEFRRSKRVVVTEEIGVTTPTTMAVIADAMDAVINDLKGAGVEYTPGAVAVTLADGEIVFSYQMPGAVEPVTAPVRKRPTPTPPRTRKAASAAPTAPTAPEPTDDATPTPTPEPSTDAVVPPFPTSLESGTRRLPELTTEAAHELVKHHGTFYFGLKANAPMTEINRVTMRPRTAAASLKKNEGVEVLIETKRLKEQDALQVTVVR